MSIIKSTRDVEENTCTISSLSKVLTIYTSTAASSLFTDNEPTYVLPQNLDSSKIISLGLSTWLLGRVLLNPPKHFFSNHYTKTLLWILVFLESKKSIVTQNRNFFWTGYINSYYSKLSTFEVEFKLKFSLAFLLP